MLFQETRHYYIIRDLKTIFVRLNRFQAPPRLCQGTSAARGSARDVEVVDDEVNEEVANVSVVAMVWRGGCG